MALRNIPVFVNQIREIQNFKIIRRSPQWWICPSSTGELLSQKAAIYS